MLTTKFTPSQARVSPNCFLQIDRLEKDHGTFSFRRNLSATAESAPTIPVGNSSTSSTSTTPSRSCQYSVVATA